MPGEQLTCNSVHAIIYGVGDDGSPVIENEGAIMTTAMREGTVWQQACREVARETLEKCELRSPPVDAWRVARQLGLRVAFDSLQEGRGRLKRIGGRTTILVRPEDRPEREQWTLAHEIGETLARRVFERLEVDPADVPAERREQAANMLASSLLLPDAWFLQDAEAFDGDVLRLKARYATASHELILLNLLKLPQLSIVSVFDQGRLTRRRGNGELSPPPLLPLERRVWREVHESGEAAEASGGGIRVQGWPVCEPGWHRELLRTTACEGLEGVEVEYDDACEGELMLID